MIRIHFYIGESRNISLKDEYMEYLIVKKFVLGELEGKRLKIKDEKFELDEISGMQFIPTTPSDTFNLKNKVDQAILNAGKHVDKALEELLKGFKK